MSKKRVSFQSSVRPVVEYDLLMLIPVLWHLTPEAAQPALTAYLDAVFPDGWRSDRPAVGRVPS